MLLRALQSSDCNVRMHRSNLYLAVTITIVLMGCSRGSSSSLSVDLEPIDSVVASDNVTVTASFSNTSDSAIVLYRWKRHGGLMQAAIGGILYFDIAKEGKDTLLCSRAGFVPLFPHSEDTMILNPGKTYTEVINLTSFYTEREIRDSIVWDSSSTWGRRLWRPGNYAIRCRYEYRHDSVVAGGRSLWRGSAISNVVELRVR